MGALTAAGPRDDVQRHLEGDIWTGSERVGLEPVPLGCVFRRQGQGIKEQRMRCLITAFAGTVLACGNPTTPTALSPAERLDFSGVWRGEYQVTACDGARNCFAYRGTQRTFSLRLSQTGPNAFGVLTVGGGVNIGGGVSVDVSGTVNQSGLLTLTGSRTAPSAFDPNGDIQVNSLATNMKFVPLLCNRGHLPVWREPHVHAGHRGTRVAVCG